LLLSDIRRLNGSIEAEIAAYDEFWQAPPTPWACRPAIVVGAMATRLFCFHASEATFSPSVGESDARFRQIDLFPHRAHGRLVARRHAAIESAGVIVVDENGEGPGVRLRKAPHGAEGLGK
jgi:hypothetical protein